MATSSVAALRRRLIDEDTDVWLQTPIGFFSIVHKDGDRRCRSDALSALTDPRGVLPCGT
ncbi:MAG: hypothetical protein ACOCXM_05985 [Myxococcota bacterium]